MLIPLPSLKDAIERDYVTVSPDARLVDVLALMNGSDRADASRMSCVMVVEGDRLAGIFTERDVVKLTVGRAVDDSIPVGQVMTVGVVTLAEADATDVSKALLLLRRHRVRHLPIVDAAGCLSGLVTSASIREILQPANMLKLRRVCDVMARSVQSALPSASVREIAEQMVCERVSSIAIVQAAAAGECVRPLGIITERDIVQFRLMNIDFERVQAREVMSAPLHCLHPADSLADAHAEMTRMRVRRLVVAGDRGELAGILTQTSILQAIDLTEVHGTIGALRQLVDDRTRELQHANIQLREEVTKRVQVEQQLQHANLQLEQRVRDRTVEIEDRNAKLRAEISERERAQARLKDYEEHLEHLVEQRTAELEVANQSLAREVVERRQVERELFREKELAQVTLQSIGDAVITTDASGCATYLNALAEQYTGWTSPEARQLPIAQVCTTFNETTGLPADCLVDRVLQEGTIAHSNHALVLRARDGRTSAIDATAAPICDREGTLVGTVLVFRDVSESRQLSHQLTHQARHDTLTGLTNRGEFERKLEAAISTAREDDRHHVLCYMDLDQFKIVNDTCGHGAGDELLRQLAELLRQRIRASDVLARLGGDEFGMLLMQCPLQRAEQIADNLRQQIADYRFIWEDKIFTIGASIGLVAIDAQTQELTHVLGAADAACYAAKDRGRNCIQVYQADDRDLARQRSERHWVARIEQALAEDRFVLFCQDIIPIAPERDGFKRQNHCEILLRLRDEAGNFVPPMAFIPAAERYGLMPQIDRWVVGTFLKQYRTFCSLKEGDSCSRIFTINLSGASLSDERFWEFLETQLTSHPIEPQNLCFEITETAAIANLSEVTKFIHKLKQLGCRFALDDFGSGMSSFIYLKTLPVDYLKIDGSFIKNITTNAIDRVMVESFIDISHEIGIQTIAEFVENSDIFAALVELEADFAQGYGIARPAPLKFYEPSLLS